MNISPPQKTFSITGPGAASGLCFDNDNLTLLSDNSTYLYQHHIQSGETTRIALALDPSPMMPKINKPDFEAIACDEKNYYIFGSGSTEKRNLMLIVDRESGEILEANELILLYAAMRKCASITMDDFNIEGVVKNSQTGYFFQRGNGPGKRNGIFTVNFENSFRENFTVDYKEIVLPEISGCSYGFTDATLVGNEVWFLACAENVASTYLDGAHLGTIIGRIDPSSMEIIETAALSANQKFEGIAFCSHSSDPRSPTTDNQTLEFFLCEDTDNDSSLSDIYKISVGKS